MNEPMSLNEARARLTGDQRTPAEKALEVAEQVAVRVVQMVGELQQLAADLEREADETLEVTGEHSAHYVKARRLAKLNAARRLRDLLPTGEMPAHDQF